MNYVLNGAGARAFAATILRPHRTFAYSHPIVIVVCLVFAAPESTEGAGARGRLRKLVKMDRAQMSLQEVWLLGGDDFGADENHLYVRFSDSALHELTARGATFEVVYDDVYAAYREYHKSLVRGLSATFADYHDVDAATEEIRTIAMNHPDIAALEVIGYSVEGRPIHALRISDDASTVDSSEPGIVVLGCHHAREWISVEVPLFFARYLVDNYLRKGDVTRLINYAEVWIVPVVNPDGLVYTRTDRFWRKNRRDNGDGTVGVDLNRNYSVGFGIDGGASALPQSEAYQGPARFSEPETQAVRAMIDGSFGRSFQASVSYHSYGQLVLYPYNFTFEVVENEARYRDIAGRMAERINETHMDEVADYTYGQSSDRLYLAGGTFTDWAHKTQRMTAMVIELRPNGAPFFELAPTEIIPTCRENLRGFLLFAEETLIPDARSADTDSDGFLDEDDDCPTSPTAVRIDASGCAHAEQDVDNDDGEEAVEGTGGPSADAAGTGTMSRPPCGAIGLINLLGACVGLTALRMTRTDGRSVDRRPSANAVGIV